MIRGGPTAWSSGCIAPGGFKSDELVELWKPLCERHDFILLAPKAADKAKWQPTEIPLHSPRAGTKRIKNYTTDPARIVIHGHEGGGAMAYLVGILNVDLFRAIAVSDAALPRLAHVPASDPTQPPGLLHHAGHEERKRRRSRSHDQEAPRSPLPGDGRRDRRASSLPDRR